MRSSVRTIWLRFRSAGGKSALTVRDAQSIAASTPDDLVAPATSEELSRMLLKPFAALLGKARTVTVLASGVLRAIAVHMLPWGKGRLGQQWTFRYSLDIPGLPPPLQPRC